VSFKSEMLPAAEIGGVLDQAFDIAIRPGLHCARTSTGPSGRFPTGRFESAPGRFNTAEDIDRLADALGQILYPCDDARMRQRVEFPPGRPESRIGRFRSAMGAG